MIMVILGVLFEKMIYDEKEGECQLKNVCALNNLKLRIECYKTEFALKYKNIEM